MAKKSFPLWSDSASGRNSLCLDPRNKDKDVSQVHVWSPWEPFSVPFNGTTLNPSGVPDNPSTLKSSIVHLLFQKTLRRGTPPNATWQERSHGVCPFGESKGHRL